MSSAVDSSKSIPLPLFDGKEEKFELFWPKFEAYASIKGFSESIKEQRDNELPSKEGQYDQDADKAKREKMAELKNKLAMASFTMSFQTVALIDRINEAKNNDYPSGLA